MAPDTGESTGLFAASRRDAYGKWDLLFENNNAKEWIAFKPALGLQSYACYSCKHLFYSKKSFLGHINRRAVVLKYKCTGCNNNAITFYNRCSFLLHCREHFEPNKGYIDLKNLEISALPLGLAGFSRIGDVPYIFDVEEECVSNGDEFINSQCYIPEPADKGNEIISLTPTNLVINGTDQNGEIDGLSLRQIAKNIPKCVFISLNECQPPTCNGTQIQPAIRIKSDPDESHSNGTPNECSDPSDQESRPQSSDNTMLTVPNNIATNTVTNTEDDSCNNKTPDNVIMPVITKIESVDESISSAEIKCPECKLTIIDSSLGNHILGENKPNSEGNRCPECKLICPTPCSFKAHVRIHAKHPPFVCPDCALEFPQLSLLKTHMEEVCYHLVKSVRFRCPGKRCGKIFASETTFGPHFRMVHIENKFRCGKCDESFLKMEECDTHRATHQEGNVNISKIYSCLCCDKPDMNYQDFKEHMDYHCKDLSRCIYIYMCKYCKGYFRSTQTMATHLRNCKVQKSGIVRRTRNISNGIPSKYASGQCRICKIKTIFLKSKPSAYCSKCLSNLGRGPPTLLKKTVLVPERCVCILCKTQIELNERRRHQTECKYAKPQVLVEKLDIEIDRDEINQTRSFSSSNSDLDGSHDGSPQKRGESSDENRPKKRHKPNKVKKPDPENDLIADEPIPFDGVYQCRLCSHRNPDRDSFHQHIKSHRHISTAYQCMECGECFVVKPSLIKHLMHFHNISDSDQYFLNNDCFDRSAVNELAKVVKNPYLANNVKENQCKVCLEQFTDSEAHDKHFRKHGMAFLMKNSV